MTSIRGAERSTIRRLLGGRDSVVLLPTGAGKSLIYQFAGLLLPGRTLVIDPLVALINDQLDGLARQGIDRGLGSLVRTQPPAEPKPNSPRSRPATPCFATSPRSGSSSAAFERQYAL